MTFDFDRIQCQDLQFAESREWLLTNGIGGFAMGTIAGINTRRYHGHLVAATSPPAERTLLLANVEAAIQTTEEPVWISSNQYADAVHPDGYRYLEAFRVGDAAEWDFAAGDASVRKILRMRKGENAVTIEYLNTSEVPLLLILRPLTACRSYHRNFTES